jgi:hypothetical protein
MTELSHDIHSYKNVSDDAKLIEMLTLNIDYFKSKVVNIPKITILLDHGYHPEQRSLCWHVRIHFGRKAGG